MAPESDPNDDVAAFFSNWSVYRAVIENDCMEHRAVYGAVREILAGRQQGARILDLGCGDAAAIGPAMLGTGITHYTGVDCAAPALEFARQTLDGLGFESYELRLGDMMDAVRHADDEYDVIVASFALHHFQTEDKREFLRECVSALKSGGEVLLIDVVRKDGETRDEYLRRYESYVETWPLAPDTKDAIHEHVRTCDFPEPVSDQPGWASELGFVRAVEFYRGGRDTQCAWRLMTNR